MGDDDVDQPWSDDEDDESYPHASTSKLPFMLPLPSSPPPRPLLSGDAKTRQKNLSTYLRQSILETFGDDGHSKCSSLAGRSRAVRFGCSSTSFLLFSHDFTGYSAYITRSLSSRVGSHQPDDGYSRNQGLAKSRSGLRYVSSRLRSKSRSADVHFQGLLVNSVCELRLTIG